MYFMHVLVNYVPSMYFTQILIKYVLCMYIMHILVNCVLCVYFMHVFSKKVLSKHLYPIMYGFLLFMLVMDFHTWLLLDEQMLK